MCAALFFFAWELRYTQHVPDVVGVRKEILQGALVSAVVGLPPYVLFLLDVGGFEEAEIREFSWVRKFLGKSSVRLLQSNDCCRLLSATLLTCCL